MSTSYSWIVWNIYIYIYTYMYGCDRDWERKNVVVKANEVKYSHSGNQGKGYSGIPCAVLVTFL